MNYGRQSFRWCCRPDRDDGLGIILLNSNADTHFSFTNALGMISMEQVRGIEIAAAQYPRRTGSSLFTTMLSNIRKWQRCCRTDRYGAGKRKLVCPAAAGIGRQGSADAWSPAYRLDRKMCRAFDRVGAVSGNGSDRRRGHLLLHSYVGGPKRRRVRVADS